MATCPLRVTVADFLMASDPFQRWSLVEINITQRREGRIGRRREVLHLAAANGDRLIFKEIEDRQITLRNLLDLEKGLAALLIVDFRLHQLPERIHLRVAVAACVA